MRHAEDSGRVQLAPARRARIVALLSAGTVVTTETICREIGASAATVRRDLALLERRGRLLRVHGGATLTGELVAPPRPEETEQLVQALAALRTANLPYAEHCLRAVLERYRSAPPVTRQ